MPTTPAGDAAVFDVWPTNAVLLAPLLLLLVLLVLVLVPEAVAPRDESVARSPSRFSQDDVDEEEDDNFTMVVIPSLLSQGSANRGGDIAVNGRVAVSGRGEDDLRFAIPEAKSSAPQVVSARDGWGPANSCFGI